MKAFLITSLLITASTLLVAQQVVLPKPDNHFRKNAEWVQMMDDPSANYYHTLRAFELYFEQHSKPLDRDDVLSEEYTADREQRNFIKKLFSREKEMPIELKEAYKRFRFWRRETEPWVQPDGSILSKEEQLKIWQQERNKK